MNLKYAKSDKTPDLGGWILDYSYLLEISDALDSLRDKGLWTDLENIEAVLLAANGEIKLLQQVFDSDEY